MRRNVVCSTRSVVASETMRRTSSRAIPRASGGSRASRSGGSSKSSALFGCALGAASVQSRLRIVSIVMADSVLPNTRRRLVARVRSRRNRELLHAVASADGPIFEEREEAGDAVLRRRAVADVLAGERFLVHLPTHVARIHPVHADLRILGGEHG